MSPNKCELGYDIKTPIDHNTKLIFLPDNHRDAGFHNQYIRNLQAISQRLAKLRLNEYDRKRKEYFDRNRSNPIYRIGEEVIRYKGPTINLSQKGKLKSKWKGPYRIKRIFNDGMNFVLEGRNKLIHTNIHKIKKYHRRDEPQHMELISDTEDEQSFDQNAEFEAAEIHSNNDSFINQQMDHSDDHHFNEEYKEIMHEQNEFDEMMQHQSEIIPINGHIMDENGDLINIEEEIEEDLAHDVGDNAANDKREMDSDSRSSDNNVADNELNQLNITAAGNPIYQTQLDQNGNEINQDNISDAEQSLEQSVHSMLHNVMNTLPLPDINNPVMAATVHDIERPYIVISDNDNDSLPILYDVPIDPMPEMKQNDDHNNDNNNNNNNNNNQQQPVPQQQPNNNGQPRASILGKRQRENNALDWLTTPMNKKQRLQLLLHYILTEMNDD